jgi:hypothetical protein
MRDEAPHRKDDVSVTHRELRRGSRIFSVDRWAVVRYRPGTYFFPAPVSRPLTSAEGRTL